MLKIKKTKPYQHNSSSVHIIICTIALICGIVPSLALLTYFTKPANAASLTLSGITTMQEMTPYICDNSTVGETNTLTDIRDESTYTVAKLSDSKCWMTQNLRIIDTEIDAANSNTDSDINNGSFVVPNSTLEDYQTAIDDNDQNANLAYYDSNTTNGAYYTYCAATAGSCSPAYDICPKNWRLPTISEYERLVTDKSAWDDTNKGFNFSGGFFNAAGYIYGNSSTGEKEVRLRSVGSSGLYWASTNYGQSSAYRLYFRKEDELITTDRNYRNSGLSVRCIAEGWPSKDVNVVAVRVSPVISIDATSGMKEEVDPNKVTTGTISATVSANTTYAVQLSADKTSLTNSQNPEDTEITNTNSIPASSNVIPKTNAWGILNQDNSTYSAITTNPTTYYNAEEYNDTEQSTKHTFGIGVSISPTLPAGEYSTTVTITAVNN